LAQANQPQQNCDSERKFHIVRLLNFQRQFRTASSEGYAIFEREVRIGRVDLHFGSENVYATIVLEVAMSEPEVAQVIEEIDDKLVVTASVKREDLNVWVYQGQEVGFFTDEFLEEEFGGNNDDEDEELDSLDDELDSETNDVDEDDEES